MADETGEIVLLKMHGSINWFNRSHYLKDREYLHRYGHKINPHNALFDGRTEFHLQKLVGNPYPEDSLLRDVYVLDDLDRYFNECNFVTEVPLIISPSFSKLAYINPLSEFWAGFSKSGVYEKRVVIVGFSLPEHDEYIRQPLYWFIHNFQKYESPTQKKTNLKMVDFRQRESDVADYKTRYRFVDWSKTDCYLGGFNKEALDMIFSED